MTKDEAGKRRTQVFKARAERARVVLELREGAGGDALQDALTHFVVDVMHLAEVTRSKLDLDRLPRLAQELYDEEKCLVQASAIR